MAPRLERCGLRYWTVGSRTVKPAGGRLFLQTMAYNYNQTAGTIETVAMIETDGSLTGTRKLPIPACLVKWGEIVSLASNGRTVFINSVDYSHHTYTVLSTEGADVGVKCVWSTSLQAKQPDYALGNHPIFNGRLLFALADLSGRYHLYISDGTAEGTRQVPGDPLIGIGGMAVVGSNVYFPVSTSEQGQELWSWDGTEQLPQLVKDINPGNGSSSPVGLTASGHLIMFQASDGVSAGQGHGAELWAYSLTLQQVWLPLIQR